MAGKGSRPGERRGGRKRGTPNKATTAASIQAEVAASGERPLDYMLRIMRDETVEAARRDAMARASAPYCHAQAIAHRHIDASGQPLAPTITVTVMQAPPEQPVLTHQGPKDTVQ